MWRPCRYVGVAADVTVGVGVGVHVHVGATVGVDLGAHVGGRRPVGGQHERRLPPRRSGEGVGRHLCLARVRLPHMLTVVTRMVTRGYTCSQWLHMVTHGYTHGNTWLHMVPQMCHSGHTYVHAHMHAHVHVDAHGMG